MVAYLDSSALIRYIFQQPGHVDLREFEFLVASELTRVESMRTLDRWRLSGAAEERTLALRRAALIDFFWRAEFGGAMGVLTFDRELARAAQVYDFTIIGAGPG
ncbi:MAG TPA: hypothetical protein VN709_03675 [Terriglobales bacterium]|nr:hypothetical protein [Terriglobales bacterium]